MHPFTAAPSLTISGKWTQGSLTHQDMTELGNTRALPPLMKAAFRILGHTCGEAPTGAKKLLSAVLGKFLCPFHGVPNH